MTPRRAVGIAAPALTAGAGLWLTMGAVAPLSTTDPSRLGVLPPLWVPLAIAAVVMTLAIVTRAETARLRALYLGALPCLPWLPVPVPAAFFLWQGPLAWGVWAAIAVSLTWRQMAAAVSALSRRSPVAQARAAAAVALVIYACAAWRMAPVLPGGDEPHYLVITQSLLRDGDLRIENNHRRRDYLAYTEQSLAPDFLRRGHDRQIYSIHAPGVSALVLPAFALGGYPASVLLLCFVAAVGTSLVWRIAFRITGSTDAAWVGWAAVALSSPFFFQAFTVYPDGPGAVLVMTGIWALAAPERLRRRPACLLHGAALAALPWLHTRFAVLAGVLGLLIVARLGRGDGFGQRATALLAIPLASAACWFGLFYAIYGTVNPAAPYGGYTQSSLLKVPAGVTGLLFDQQFGVLPNAPIFLAAFAGLPALWQRARRLTIEILVLSVPYVVAVASYHMWWGGRSSPARFIVPVLLPLGLAAGARWAATRDTRARALFLALLAASVSLSVALAWVDRGALVYNVRDGVALWASVAAPVVNLPAALPSLFRGTWPMALGLGLTWIVSLVATVAAIRALAARARPRREEVPGEDTRRPAGTPRGLVVPGAAAACGAALMVGAAAGWALSRSSPLDPGPGLLRVLRTADARRPLTVRLPSYALVDRAGAFSSLRVPTGLRRPRPASILYAASDVPPGRYGLIGDSPLRVSGTLAVTAGRGLPPVASAVLADAPPGALPFTLDLPAGCESLVISGDAAAERTVGTVLLQPIEVLSTRVADLATAGVRYGRAVAWFTDAGAFIEPDGFWVRGRGQARVAIASEPDAITVEVVVRNGAVQNEVRLAGGGWMRSFRLQPGDERAVVVPSNVARAGLTIASAAGFRPVDVDPSSSDTRVLGTWVTMR